MAKKYRKEQQQKVPSVKVEQKSAPPTPPEPTTPATASPPLLDRGGEQDVALPATATLQQRRAHFALTRIRVLAEEWKEDAKKQKEFNSYASAMPFMIHANGLGQTAAFYRRKGTEHTDYRLYKLLGDWLSQPDQPVCGSARSAGGHHPIQHGGLSGGAGRGDAVFGLGQEVGQRVSGSRRGGQRMNWPLYRLETTPMLATEGNRGLWYNRFFNRYGADWKIPEDGKRQWVSDNARSAAGQREVLQAQALRQLALITALGGRGAVFATDWHFASGLGLPHPVENGLAWHHTLGVPYLAGSGVKGLVKAWVEVWDESLNEEEKKRRAIDWFGTTDQAGGFRFFDALPVESVMLVADVMTPHMAKWYEQGDKIENEHREPDKVPADWHDPVPVPFLVVKSAKLLFGVAPRHPKCAEELPQVFAALKQALDWLGAGAKTAAGYGRMVEAEDASASLREKAEQAKAKAEEEGLGPEQRALRALRGRLEADQKRGIKEAGGELINQTNQLLKDGLIWPAPERKELATLAEAIFGYVGWGAKRKERKEKIAALRG
jgi:CRISPR-associated protein Cmr6